MGETLFTDMAPRYTHKIVANGSLVQYVRQIFGHFFFAHLFRVKTAKTCRAKTSFSALFFMLDHGKNLFRGA